jgi:hypothetical protein
VAKEERQLQWASRVALVPIDLVSACTTYTTYTTLHYLLE